MNINYEDYVQTVRDNVRSGLAADSLSIAESLPCYIFRELEVPVNAFTESTEPLALSYRSLPRVLSASRPPIPRKIDFGCAVYLKEAIVDTLFPDAPVTILIIGDGLSDKRFAYNTYRLLMPLGDRYDVQAYIGNSDLIGGEFAGRQVGAGWHEDPQKTYSAANWGELQEAEAAIRSAMDEGRHVLVVVDIDGTYLCPRPSNNGTIKQARRAAISRFADSWFDDADFSFEDQSQIEQLERAYTNAASTRFSGEYDDEDLTMLLAFGIYLDIIQADDVLLNRKNDVGFVLPIEFLTYANFLIDSQTTRQGGRAHRRLRSLYTKCADILLQGSPTAFPQMRVVEEEVLRAWSSPQEGSEPQVVLSRQIAEFIATAADCGAVPIAFSDRPNASMGLVSNADRAFTTTPKQGAFIEKPLALR